MLARSVTAVDRLSKKLQFVAFQTGAKVHLSACETKFVAFSLNRQIDVRVSRT